VIDLAQIAASFASFGAMSITVKVGSAAARSGYFVSFVGGAAVGDAVQLVALSKETVDQLDQINRGVGTPEDRQRASSVLIAQLMVTTGLTALSVRGARNLRVPHGPPLELVEQNGVTLLRVAGEDTSAVVGESKTAPGVTHAPPSVGERAPIPATAATKEAAATTQGAAPSQAVAERGTTSVDHADGGVKAPVHDGTKAETPAPQTRRQILGLDPHRGYIDYEGVLGEEIEGRFGGFDRDPTGAGEWIGRSGAYKGKCFDLLGLPPGKAQYHAPSMERFLPSVDLHFLKQIDYIVLDTRSMTSIQKQAVMDYIQRRWSTQIARLIVL